MCEMYLLYGVGGSARVVVRRYLRRKGKRMTRKDFEAIAEVMAGMKRDSTRRDGLVVEATAKRLADMLYGTNPRFDRERFMRACGF